MWGFCLPYIHIHTPDVHSDSFPGVPYLETKLWFVNMCGWLPRRTSVGDRNTLYVLRRENLDIFWSRDTATVKGIIGYTYKIIRREREGGCSKI